MNIAMNMLNFKEVTPTRAELGKWLEGVDDDVGFARTKALKKALDEIRSKQHATGLQPGDRVKVTKGWAKELRGTVASINGDDTLVVSKDMSVVSKENPSSSPAMIPIHSLQKTFEVGDFVHVLFGPDAGLDGWFVGMTEGMLLVSEHGTHREVRCKQITQIITL
jgi:ribosomal protein L24